MVTTETVPEIVLKDFIRRQLEIRHRLPAQLARDLGVSHPTVGRWLTGEDTPNPKACWALAELTGEPLVNVMKMAGHLPAHFEIDPIYQLPAFREYLMHKYPGRLHESQIRMIEHELVEL